LSAVVKWEAVFQPEFLQDLRWWVETDRKIALRLLLLVEDVLRDPFHGIGKPEPLKYQGSYLEYVEKTGREAPGVHN